jgi:hypothetical protein
MNKPVILLLLMLATVFDGYAQNAALTASGFETEDTLFDRFIEWIFMQYPE